MSGTRAWRCRMAQHVSTSHLHMPARPSAPPLSGPIVTFLPHPLPACSAGAIFGIGGALAVYYYRNRWAYGKKSDFMLRQLWQTLVMNLAYSLFNPRIDNWWVAAGRVLLTVKAQVAQRPMPWAGSGTRSYCRSPAPAGLRPPPLSLCTQPAS